jgi:hypothetical protein
MMRKTATCLLLGLLWAVQGFAQGSVAWQEWGQAPFAEARRLGRPVLVDAEATWCHWCHVMETRTYGDPEVAGLLNGAFVAIKADIDRHPDAQELYADIGWPGTTLYAPDGRVLWRRRGYVPKEDLLPVLRRVVQEVKSGVLIPWQEEPASPGEAPPTGDLLKFARTEVDDTFDEDFGGWGEQKYPIAMNLEELLRRGGDGARFRALYTLSQQRAITDPVWGGLFQYSAGPHWHAVHFEKLATLQAGYLENLGDAYRATGDGDWHRDARQVLGFLRRFLAHPDGGWSATVDADLGGHGAARPRLLGEDYYALGSQARLDQGLPRTDTRRYAQVQGLLISACARLSGSLDDSRLLPEARAALAFAEARLRSGDGYRHAEGQEGLFLQDQAAMFKGLLNLFEATGDEALLQRAQRLASFLDARFRAPDGLYLLRADAGALPGSDRRPVDENLGLARAFLQLEAITGAAVWRERAQAIADRLCTRSGLEGQGRWLGDAILLLAELKEEAPHLVVVGAPQDARTRALVEAGRRAWLPGAVLLRHDPARATPLNPELSFPVLAEPAAFLCGRGTCSAPLKTPEALIREARRRP